MKTAWTLMTAMPPTRGHQNLMEFVGLVSGTRGKVVLCTQPEEPMVQQRYQALYESRAAANVDIVHLHRTLPQDPATPGFWDMWKSIMTSLGFQPGDIFVSSETYGATMAEVMGGTFLPFDPNRELHPAKATLVRDNPEAFFDHIMPRFQKHLLTTVTLWGAESTGKTTLSKELARTMDAHWLYEYARPYLETVGPEITVEKMENIWFGQCAAQRLARNWLDRPYLIQDTDLYSTIGYWAQPHWEKELGPVPEGLIMDAKRFQSDLYIILKSDIPFEPDAIRYGVDERESPDSYWIDLADQYGLPYVVLTKDDLKHRAIEARALAHFQAEKNYEAIAFDRHGF